MTSLPLLTGKAIHVHKMIVFLIYQGNIMSASLLSTYTKFLAENKKKLFKPQRVFFSRTRSGFPLFLPMCDISFSITRTGPWER